MSRQRFQRIALFSAIIAILLVGIYLLRFFGNQHRQIATAGDIVYASDQGSPGHSHIFRADPANLGATRQITHGNADDTDPAFSPDGSQITFISDRGGAPQVYLMDANGGGVRALSFGNDAKSRPQFSPGGSEIAYLSRGQLIVDDIGTGQTVLLLPTNAGVASANTEQLANAVRSPVTDFAWSPTANPSDSQIAAVQQTTDGDLDTISILPASGGAPKVVLGARALSFAWAPGGATLAAAGLGIAVGGAPGASSFSGMLLLNADGSPVHQAPLASSRQAALGPQQPDFSPDGSQIAFEIERTNALGIALPAGIAITQTHPTQSPRIVAQGAAHRPQFSPTGGQLLFTAPLAAAPSQQGVYVFDLATGGVTLASGATGNVTSASWSPSVAGKGG